MPTVEQVINKPLNGKEIRDIVMAKVAERLNGDTRLADYMAFPAFEFKFTLTMILENAVHDKIELEGAGKRGEVNPASDGLVGIQAVVSGERMPPNQARVDAGLEVPVLTTDDKGRPTEKGVKYGKEQLARKERERGA